MHKHEESKVKNPKHPLSFMKKLLPKYFDGQWSFAHLKVGDNGPCLCAFTEDEMLTAITLDGHYYIAQIPKNGGDCQKKDTKKLIS